MATTPDYAIISSPRISAAKFAAVLRAGSSPAAAEADACYRAIAATGVDPAVALAVFRKESTFGRFGRANRNRSWGNIRGGTTYPLDSGHFRIYPSWTAGAADIGRLLAVYGSNRIRPGTRTDSVQTMPYVWAPSSDGNAPDAYGDTLARWIADWTGQPGSSSSGPPTGPSSAPPDASTVLSIVNASTAAACTTYTIIAPVNRLQEVAGLFKIPREDVANPCVECAPGYVKAVVTVTPPMALEGYVPPEELFAGTANACVRAGTKVGDHPGVGGIPGQIADSIPAAIAAFGDALGNIVTHGLILIALIAIVLLGLYFIATSDS